MAVYQIIVCAQKGKRNKKGVMKWKEYETEHKINARDSVTATLQILALYSKIECEIESIQIDMPLPF